MTRLLCALCVAGVVLLLPALGLSGPDKAKAPEPPADKAAKADKAKGRGKGSAKAGKGKSSDKKLKKGVGSGKGRQQTARRRGHSRHRSAAARQRDLRDRFAGRRSAARGLASAFSRLKLTADQKKQMGELRKKMAAEFQKILTPEQRKTLEQLRKGRGGRGKGAAERKPAAKPEQKSSAARQRLEELRSAFRARWQSAPRTRDTGRGPVWWRKPVPSSLS
jgi:Spy/CpxP family protein refolding chaperone